MGIGTVEAAREALLKYKKTGEFPTIPHNDKFRYDVWCCVFEKELPVWEHIAIAEIEYSLKSAVADEISPHFAALLCSSELNVYSEYRLNGSGMSKAKKAKWKSMFARIQRKIFEMWTSKLNTKEFIDSLEETYDKFGENNCVKNWIQEYKNGMV